MILTLSFTSDGSLTQTEFRKTKKYQNLLAYKIETSRGCTEFKWGLLRVSRQWWPCLSIFFCGKDDPNNAKLAFYEFKQCQWLKSMFPIRSSKSLGASLHWFTLSLIWLSYGTVWLVKTSCVSILDSGAWGGVQLHLHQRDLEGNRGGSSWEDCRNLSWRHGLG